MLLISGGPLLYDEVKFVHNSEYLNGTQRVQLDNVISEEECQELQGVASVSEHFALVVLCFYTFCFKVYILLQNNYADSKVTVMITLIMNTV